jgi:hypothetical protein
MEGVGQLRGRVSPGVYLLDTALEPQQCALKVAPIQSPFGEESTTSVFFVSPLP